MAYTHARARVGISMCMAYTHPRGDQYVHSMCMACAQWGRESGRACARGAAERLHVRVREERSACKGAEGVMRERRRLRVGEVVEDVPLGQLEQLRRVVHGVLVRLLLEEVGVPVRRGARGACEGRTTST